MSTQYTPAEVQIMPEIPECNLNTWPVSTEFAVSQSLETCVIQFSNTPPISVQTLVSVRSRHEPTLLSMLFANAVNIRPSIVSETKIHAYTNNRKNYNFVSRSFLFRAFSYSNYIFNFPAICTCAYSWKIKDVIATTFYVLILEILEKLLLLG